MLLKDTGPIAIDANGEIYTGHDTYEQEYSRTNQLREGEAAGSVQFVSREEKLKLADMMIARWEAYKRGAV